MEQEGEKAQRADGKTQDTKIGKQGAPVCEPQMIFLGGVGGMLACSPFSPLPFPPPPFHSYLLKCDSRTHPHKRLVPHSFCLESVYHVFNGVVNVGRHSMVRPSERVLDEVELVVPNLGYL